MYNGAQVASAAVLAFLGATKLKAAPNSIFMVHKSLSAPQLATVKKLKSMSESLILDDGRSAIILKEHLVNMPKEHWEQPEHHDVHFSGEDAVKFGLATEVGHFSPTVGTTLFNAIL